MFDCYVAIHYLLLSWCGDELPTMAGLLHGESIRGNCCSCVFTRFSNNN